MKHTQILEALKHAESLERAFAERLTADDRAMAEFANGTANGLRMALELLGVEVPGQEQTEPESIESELAGFDY